MEVDQRLNGRVVDRTITLVAGLVGAAPDRP
jgi:hypothetical protein